VIWYYNSFLSMSYDAEFAQLRGVAVNRLFFIMIGMIAVSVVIIMRVVGLILVIALLTIPPYIAEKYSKSLVHMMIFSTILSLVFTVGGLWLSYQFNLTSGPCIILLAGVGFFLSLFAEKLRSS